MIDVIMSLSEYLKPNESSSGDLWKRSNLGTIIWFWFLLDPLTQRKHHDYCLREKNRNVELTIITNDPKFDSLVVMPFLTLDFQLDLSN